METLTHNADAYFHVRVLIGLVTGLGLTRLLTGLARFVQHPSRAQIYLPHLVWVFFMLIYIAHFWWFEFGLSVIGQWEFDRYVFVIAYAALLFFITSILFPDQMNEYSGFADYFMSRKQWFYALLGLMFVIDMLDSLIKGQSHFVALGPLYPVRQTGLALLCVAAMLTKNPRFHASFAAFAVLAELWWITTKFRFLGLSG